MEKKAVSKTADKSLRQSAKQNFNQQLASVSRAIVRHSGQASLYAERGRILFQLQRPADALKDFDRAIRISPGFADAHSNRGVALRALGRLDEALASYDKAISLQPEVPDNHSNRANVLRDVGRMAEALESCDDALRCDADFVNAHLNRALILLELARPEEALANSRKAAALQPRSADAYKLSGKALNDLNRPHEALAASMKAMELNPNDAMIYNNVGYILKSLGQIDDAVLMTRQGLMLNPTDANLLQLRSQLDTVELADTELEALETLVGSPAQNTGDPIKLHFTLGKTYGDAGAFERSFGHFAAGNSLKRGSLSYQERDALALLDRFRKTFSNEVMTSRSGVGFSSEAPIFIVGMPRSGSTLVEQILAGHADVYAAGEVDTLRRAIRATVPSSGNYVEDPEALLNADPDAFGRIGAFYSSEMLAEAAGAKRVTDKLPDNFRLLGPLHLALPQAKIIHTLRNRLDTCLSCYVTNFSDNQPFSYDLQELGHYYAAYDRLMAHWRNVLPPDAILDVNYEDIVTDLEGQARRLISFCGLNWDADCLTFWTHPRPVRTASAVQVRQPLYSNSVGRWRNYEPFLAPLQAALSDSSQPAN